jgi:hypothetical protein
MNRQKSIFWLSLGLFLGTTAFQAAAQVTYTAEDSALPLRVGAGFSSYYTEIYPQRLIGPSVWVDWTFRRTPIHLQGLGVEAEARGLLWGQPAGSTWSFFTAGGGPIYHWSRKHRIQPYGKFLVNYGAQSNIKITGFPAWYKSDKWTTFAPGAGVDLRLEKHLWLRGDWEYQFWKVMWFNDHYLNPTGVTVGVSYDFGARK